MSAPTAYEQYVLELVNRARLDPKAEADRLGIGLNSGLSSGTISASSKQPLAFNSNINDAAEDHSRWMLNVDRFSHTGAGGSDPGDRMADAGYRFTGNWTWGENIAWNGSTGGLNQLRSTRMAHDGLFKSAGHRVNILSDSFKEIGVGIETGLFTTGNTYNALMLTQNFGRSGSGNFITGVVYNDSNNDDFYSIGEGRSGVNVSLSKNGSVLESGKVWASGGYSHNTTASGDLLVKFSGGGLPAPVSVEVEVSNQNVKVDLVGTSHIAASASIRLVNKARSAELLGLDDLDATGNRLANKLTGNSGDNVLSGGGGNDKLIGGDGNDILRGGQGRDTLNGGNGRDKLFGHGGNDKLIAGTGNDVLIGGSGNDVLSGDAGNDRLKGNGGADVFQFTRGGDRDMVKDFRPGTDRLDLSDFNLNSANAARSASRDGSGNVIFDMGQGDVLVLKGLQLADLSNGDFIL